MSTPILPFAVWASGTNQNSIPANDNSLRNQILNGLVISDSTDAQPGSPADGDIYIITGAATGTQWATFDQFDLAIFDSGTWYAFAPVEGVIVNIAGTLNQWNGTAYVLIGGTSGAAADITYDNSTSGLTATDVQAAIDELASAPPGSGDVVGPDSSTNNVVAVFDGTTGKLLKDGATYVGQTSITTVGTVATGTWNATAISAVKGGTGQTGYAVGDLLYASSTTALSKLVAGTNGHVLTLAAGVPTWAAGAASVTSVNGDTGTVIVAAPICIACSDETTALTTGTAKATFRMPYAFTLTAVRASVTTAPTGSVLTVDINEGGSSILSTKITIDATEKTSTTAATPPVMSDTSLADDVEMTIDIDTVGSTIAGAGLKVWLIGYAT